MKKNNLYITVAVLVVIMIGAFIALKLLGSNENSGADNTEIVTQGDAIVEQALETTEIEEVVENATEVNDDTEVSETTEVNDDTEVNETTEANDDAKASETTEINDDAKASETTEVNDDAKAGETTEVNDDAKASETIDEDKIEQDTSEKEVVTYRFRNQNLLDQHYEKHGIEMGFPNAETYEAAASDVINNPEALNKVEAEDGDFVYYVEATNEFVILSTDGYIRTYFYPSAGKSYYDRQ